MNYLVNNTMCRLVDANNETMHTVIFIGMDNDFAVVEIGDNNDYTAVPVNDLRDMKGDTFARFDIDTCREGVRQNLTELLNDDDDDCWDDVRELLPTIDNADINHLMFIMRQMAWDLPSALNCVAGACTGVDDDDIANGSCQDFDSRFVAQLIVVTGMSPKSTYGFDT